MKEYENNVQLTKQESENIWKMKAYAVIAIVCAHCASIPESVNGASLYFSKLLNCWGALGVPVFFFLLGYLFRYRSIKELVLVKLKNLVVPWLFCGTLVYVYVYIRKGEINIFSWLNWIIGNGTYLWYMTITLILLMWLEMVCLFARRKKIRRELVSTVMIVVCVFFLVLEGTGILRMHLYLNPFRWGWLCFLGMCARSWFPIRKWIRTTIGNIIILFLVLILPFIEGQFNYWSVLFFPYAIMVIFFSFSFTSKFGSLVSSIGRNSYSIYLLHMPIAGIVTNITNRYTSFFSASVVLRPVIVVVTTMVIIELLKRGLSTKNSLVMLIGANR